MPETLQIKIGLDVDATIIGGRGEHGVFNDALLGALKHFKLVNVDFLTSYSSNEAIQSSNPTRNHVKRMIEKIGFRVGHIITSWSPVYEKDKPLGAYYTDYLLPVESYMDDQKTKSGYTDLGSPMIVFDVDLNQTAIKSARAQEALLDKIADDKIGKKEMARHLFAKSEIERPVIAIFFDDKQRELDSINELQSELPEHVRIATVHVENLSGKDATEQDFMAQILVAIINCQIDPLIKAEKLKAIRKQASCTGKLFIQSFMAKTPQHVDREQFLKVKLASESIDMGLTPIDSAKIASVLTDTISNKKRFNKQGVIVAGIVDNYLEDDSMLMVEVIHRLDEETFNKCNKFLGYKWVNKVLSKKTDDCKSEFITQIIMNVLSQYKQIPTDRLNENNVIPILRALRKAGASIDEALLTKVKSLMISNPKLISEMMSSCDIDPAITRIAREVVMAKQETRESVRAARTFILKSLVVLPSFLLSREAEPEDKIAGLIDFYDKANTKVQDGLIAKLQGLPTQNIYLELLHHALTKRLAIIGQFDFIKPNEIQLSNQYSYVDLLTDYFVGHIHDQNVLRTILSQLRLAHDGIHENELYTRFKHNVELRYMEQEHETSFDSYWAQMSGCRSAMNIKLDNLKAKVVHVVHEDHDTPRRQGNVI